MKNLLLLLIFISLFSCSPEETTQANNTEQNYTTTLSSFVLNESSIIGAVQDSLFSNEKLEGQGGINKISKVNNFNKNSLFQKQSLELRLLKPLLSD